MYFGATSLVRYVINETIVAPAEKAAAKEKERLLNGKIEALKSAVETLQKRQKHDEELQETCYQNLSNTRRQLDDCTSSLSDWEQNSEDWERKYNQIGNRLARLREESKQKLEASQKRLQEVTSEFNTCSNRLTDISKDLATCEARPAIINNHCWISYLNSTGGHSKPVQTPCPAGLQV